MGTYSSTVVDGNGVAITTATVAVFNQDGTDAAIENDAGEPISNRIPVDEDGNFSFVAVDGVYKLVFTWGGSVRRVEFVQVGTPVSEPQVVDINTIMGVNIDDGDLGTFTGSTIANDRSVKGALQDLETAIERLPRFTPEQYGATAGTASADIIANNTAFAALTAALTAADGGIVEMYPGRTYVVGKQTANSNGIRFEGANILYGENLKYFIVRGNGATLKMAPGLYFGGYTSAVPPVATTSTTNGDSSQRADQGILLRASGCDTVYIENLFLDGNCANGIVGGPWGDTGRQCISYGLHLFNNLALTVVNCHANDWLLDGMAAGYTGQTNTSAAAPMLFENCTSLRSGRNCFSLTGGNNPTFTDCLFSDAGNAVNTTFGRVTSSPASCFDVEAESTVIRRPIFINCTFYSGLYGSTAFVTDSGDSRDHYFNRCKFDGNVFINKPGVLMENCEVNGAFGKVYGGATIAADNMVIRNLRGYDVPQSGIVLTTNLFIDGGGSGSGVVIEGGQIQLTQRRMNIRNYVVDGLIVKVSFGTTNVANQEYAILAEGTNMRNVIFIDDTGSVLTDPPTTNEGYSINVDSNTVAYNCSITAKASFTLKWNSWSGGAGGYPRTGRTDARFDSGLDRFQGIMLQREANFGGGENEWASIVALNAAPSVGSYKLGSLVINTTTSSGGAWAWTQSSGAFVPVGIVGGIQATTVAAPAGGATVDTEARTAISSILTALKTAKLMAT